MEPPDGKPEVPSFSTLVGTVLYSYTETGAGDQIHKCEQTRSVFYQGVQTRDVDMKQDPESQGSDPLASACPVASRLDRPWGTTDDS